MPMTKFTVRPSFRCDVKLRIVTVWCSRDHLDHYLASVDKPFAVGLLESAGGETVVDLLDLVIDSNTAWWPWATTPAEYVPNFSLPISGSVFGVVGETAPDPVAEVAR